MTPHEHFTLTSDYAKWARYDPATKTLFVCFPKDAIYAYDNVPAHVFDNLKTAKASAYEPEEGQRKPIGLESPGSEGSYLIHHVVGRDRKNPPYTFRKLTPEEVSDITNA
jgi:hypothetical protein